MWVSGMPGAPSWMVQVTAMLVAVTVAMNVCIAPMNTVAAGGETMTVTGGTVTVAVAVPVMEAVTVSVAVMVWLPTVFRVAEKGPVPVDRESVGWRKSVDLGGGAITDTRK